MALGRGLGALIEDANTIPREVDGQQDRFSAGTVQEVDIEKITANPFQPRTTFDEEALQELSDSIKELGIIQPLTVRVLEDGFQLIAGERRLRAAKIAGLKTVPAYFRTADDQGMLEMALVENIQREDLDAIEVAISYQRLVDECNLTHDSLSERVGKKRTTVTNYLRLLKLPAEIQVGIRERKLYMGHARAILSLEDNALRMKAFELIIENDLSVRKAEDLVRKLAIQPQITPSKEGEKEEPNEEIGIIEEKLQEYLGWGVQVKQSKSGAGKIIISYRTQGELDELMERMSRFPE